MLFPAFCQENLLMPSKGFGLFRLILSKGLVLFLKSNPIAVNPVSIKGLMNQIPTLIMDLNRDSSKETGQRKRDRQGKDRVKKNND
jgi:hypothetical protein